MDDAVSRRALFRRAFHRVATTVAEEVQERIERKLPPRRRPPGAIEEFAFLARCTRCDKCADACPEAAIYTVAPGPDPAAGTPVMVPDERPCLMCEGFPCAAACPEGALVVPTSKTWDLGTVAVDPGICFTFRGPECGACGGMCPTEVPALTFRQARPHVNTDLCVGCGLCIRACVTAPKSIRLLPLRNKEDTP